MPQVDKNDPLYAPPARPIQAKVDAVYDFFAGMFDGVSSYFATRRMERGLARIEAAERKKNKGRS